MRGDGTCGLSAIDDIGLGDGSVPTDQRGATRPTGSACDIGSVEQ